MGDLNHDFRFALRMLRKNPGFMVVAVLVLAVGIGASTAIFSVVDAVLLRTLPYPHADRLVIIQDRYEFGATGISYPQYLFWKSRSQIFAHVITMRPNKMAFTGQGEPEQINALNISADTLATLGISPLAGRGFGPEEDARTANPVAMLTEPFWRSRFQSRLSVVGQTLTLDDRVYTVVGVLPENFRLGRKPDVVMPLRLDMQVAPEHLNFLAVVGELQPGIGLNQGRAAIQTAFPQYKQADPDLTGVSLISYRESMVANSRTLLLVLLGAALAVLLIACANIANLLLARAAAREKEIAVRISLGAGRMRLARQLLTESVLLGLLGGLLGVLLAWASLGLLRSLLARWLPTETAIRLDLRILAFAALLALFTGIVFGLAPVLQVLRGNVHDRLKLSGRQPGGGAGRQLLKQGLVVSEIAISVVLLVSTLLLLRSLVRLINIDKGFSTEHVLTMSVRPSAVRYSDPRKEIDYIQQISRSVRALPGVQASAFVHALPLSGRGAGGSVTIEGHQGDFASPPHTDKQYMDGDYFQALNIPLLQGRFFQSSDTSDSAKVIIINQAFARKFFPNQDPIGKHIDVSWGENQWSQIIGVVGNQKTETLGAADRPSTYTLYAQSPNIMKSLGFNLVVRTSQDPMGAVPAIRSAIHQLDSEQAIAEVKTMDQQLEESLTPQRAPTWLFGGFSGIALFLAAIGIYGVLSNFVQQRSQEIGVRMALGAQRARVVQLILRQGARLIALGVGIGLVAALLAGRALTSLLFGVKPSDASTLVGVSLLLGLLGLLACAVPAFRATRIEPMVVLRSE